MTNEHDQQEVDFTVDRDNLYREEGITDLKTASIRKLIPVKQDGSPDTSRPPIFVGSTQLMTPDGPLPIQARLTATTLEDAFDEFPNAMQVALEEVIEQLKEMHAQSRSTKKSDSRIIVPGR